MDKVQKIREKVERKLDVMQYQVHRKDAYKELKSILAYIDEVQKESVSERFAFKAIPRLLEMIEPTDRAKAYIAKLADALEVEGYHTDAKIVMESLKIMNGEKVPMATMNEEPVSEDLGGYINELSKQFPEVSFAKLSRIAIRVAKWQKKQLMKDAIECKVDWYDGFFLNYTQEQQDGLLEKIGADVGDKVRVIVIKED